MPSTRGKSFWEGLIEQYGAEVLSRQISEMTPEQAEALLWDWATWARPEQLWPPGAWRVWMCLAGRGWGKTRTGAEACRHAIDQGYRRLALVAPTAADARDVMVEGESGILAIFPYKQRPTFNPSNRRISFSNGAIATLYSADQPERLRGPQHDFAWCDETASWRRPEAWDMLMLGLRLGEDPRAVVTGTPKPLKLIRDLAKAKTTHLTTGTTFDNQSNLAPAFFADIIRKYEGTRLGRQELNAEILGDTPGALWNWEMIEASRCEQPPELVRIVVAIDPATTFGEDSDETGIIAAGLGVDGRAYVLEDGTERAAPLEWCRSSIRLYHKLRADRIIGETNNGGDLIEVLLRQVDPLISYQGVTASRNKITRAEPIAALYEQGRVKHVGAFPEMEEQMCNYVPSPGVKSPDRMDALVWALTALMIDQGPVSDTWTLPDEEIVSISPY